MHKVTNPTFTIITIVHNGERFIADSIESVISQSFTNYQYIVIDNASKDQTLNIINNYGTKITQVISEPDAGIYFALNKGLSLATGQIIGFLHADDFYANNQVLEKINQAFDAETEAIYGDLDYISRTDKTKIIREWKSGSYKPNSFYYGWMPPHPTFFVRKEVYQRFGGYNTKLKSAADYELMLRFLLKHKINLKYIPEVLVKMRVGGQSNRKWKSRIKANLEDRKAWRINQIKPKWFTLLLKPIRKISQYF